MEDEKVFSVKETAFVLGWSADTVRRLIRRGELRATRLPGVRRHGKRETVSYRIREHHIKQFLDRNEVK